MGVMKQIGHQDTIDHNYNWVKELKLKINNSIDENEKLLLITEQIYD